MSRAKTLDRGATPIHTTEQLSARRARTPEGYLVVYDVPIMRTGMMVYAARETPVPANKEGFTRIWRDADVLFDEGTVASFNGKPIVNDHPEEQMGPTNWRDHTEGIILNPRRGTGQDADVILADLLITSPDAIRDIEAGKREVSAGYNADYETVKEGEGRQRNIFGNHLALVTRGRCGPRCAIGDHEPYIPEGVPVGTENKRRVKLDDDTTTRVRKAFRDAEAELLGGDEEEGGEGLHVHVHTGPAPVADGAPDSDAEKRLKALEDGQQTLVDAMSKVTDAVAKIGTAGPAVVNDADLTKDLDGVDALPDEIEVARKSKAGDSIALESGYATVVADAEILVPGFRVPTFDAKIPRRMTMDSMCHLRRSVIDHLAMTADGAGLLNSVGGANMGDLRKLSCASTAILFRSAAGAKRAINNNTSTMDAHGLPKKLLQPAGAVKTISQLNEANRKYYGTAA